MTTLNLSGKAMLQSMMLLGGVQPSTLGITTAHATLLLYLFEQHLRQMLLDTGDLIGFYGAAAQLEEQLDIGASKD